MRTTNIYDTDKCSQDREGESKILAQMSEMFTTFTEKLNSLQSELDAFKLTKSTQGQTNVKGRGRGAEIVCFGCGERGHFKRSCPTLRNGNGRGKPSVRPVQPKYFRRKWRQRSRPPAYLGLNNSHDEAGIYINLTVNGVQGKFLVDTGATISLISKRVFYSIPMSTRPEIRQIQQTVISVNGTSL